MARPGGPNSLLAGCLCLCLCLTTFIVLIFLSIRNICDSEGRVTSEVMLKALKKVILNIPFFLPIYNLYQAYKLRRLRYGTEGFNASNSARVETILCEAFFSLTLRQEVKQLSNSSLSSPRGKPQPCNKSALSFPCSRWPGEHLGDTSSKDRRTQLTPTLPWRWS